jgi:hypothetical protein
VWCAPRWHVFMLIDHGLCCDNESNIFYVHFDVMALEYCSFQHLIDLVHQNSYMNNVFL